MSIAEPDIDYRIAARIRALRTEKGLTLERVALWAGVSRAMLSRIERGESSPTAQLLNKLRRSRHHDLPAVRGNRGPRQPPPAARTSRPWSDPATRYLRRHVAPGHRFAGRYRRAGVPARRQHRLRHAAPPRRGYASMLGAGRHAGPGTRRGRRSGSNRRLSSDALRPADPLPQSDGPPGPLRCHHQPGEGARP